MSGEIRIFSRMTEPSVENEIAAPKRRRKLSEQLGELVAKAGGEPIVSVDISADAPAASAAVAETPDGEIAVDNSLADDADVVATPLDTRLLTTLEVILFSTHHPMTPGRLGEVLELESTKLVRTAVRQLNELYESSGRSFRVENVAGGYQLLTLPEHGELLARLQKKEADAKLTNAAIETLTIIAYKQPILRAEIEAIRGVASGETIRSLMEKHLVKIAGRAEEPGRPILYGTTKRFLEVFGLNNLKDLPQPDGER